MIRWPWVVVALLAVPVALVSPRSSVVPAPAAPPVTFVDVTRSAGIEFRHFAGAFGAKYMPETMGAGVCVLDFDNDGRPDLIFVNGTAWPDRPSPAAMAASRTSRPAPG